MKKVSLFGVILSMAVLMFTSCLGDGGGNIDKIPSVGVIRFDQKAFRNVMDISAYESIYSIAFNEMNPGDCCWAYFELDKDLPANKADSIKKYGYYTVRVIQKEQISKYNMYGSLTDTSKLLTDEIAIINPIRAKQYVQGKLFLEHELKEPKDQKTSWNLSYDPNKMVTEDGNYRIYDVFIRATNSGTQPAELISSLKAYDMEYYLKQVANQEKQLDNKTFYLRFNYVSEIKDSVMVWKASERIETYVDVILPPDNSN